MRRSPNFGLPVAVLCTAIALFGCNRAQTETEQPVSQAPAQKPPAPERQSKPAHQAIYVVPKEFPTDVDKSEQIATELVMLARKIKGEQIDCLAYHTNKEEGPLVAVNLHEVHNEKCGGDPATAPLRDRYLVNTFSRRIAQYDVVSAELNDVTTDLDDRWFEIEQAPAKCVASDGPGPLIKSLREKDVNFGNSDTTDGEKVVASIVTQFGLPPAKRAFYRGIMRCAGMALSSAMEQEREQAKYR